MKLGNLIDGLNVLRPFYNDPDGYHIGAEHDQFYAFKTDKPLTNEATQKMIDLGWFQDYEYTEGDEDFALRHYDADESWTAYM